jgi:hypothetical protein
VEKLEIEKLNCVDSNIQKEVQKQESSKNENLFDISKYKGTVSNTKFDGSDFGSLEDSNIKVQLKKPDVMNDSFDNNEELPNVIVQIGDTLGVDSSNPLGLDKVSIKTESVQEEKKSEEFIEIKKKTYNRYFDDVSNIKCFKCGQVGHTRNTCLDTSKVSG